MPLNPKVTETLNARLKFQGGNAEGRFINDKLTSLKRALLYSYQACTIELEDGRHFRGLMNPNKLKPDYDNKILSIPFRDVQLNPELIKLDENGHPIRTEDGKEDINVKCGQFIRWVETNSIWIVFLRHLEEDAYFRGEVRRCDQKWKMRHAEDSTANWCYIRGPVETSVQWAQKGGIEWSALNYSLVMYVPKTQENLKNLKRFSKIDVQEPIYLETNDNGNEDREWRQWYVAAVDPYYGDGIIEVMLDEDHKNSVEEEFEKEKTNVIAPEPDIDAAIVGRDEVYGFSNELYTTTLYGGKWATDLPEVKIIESDERAATIEIGTGKAGWFKLFYIIDKDTVYSKTIKIKPM